jgi:hypothetical protein
MKVKEASFCFFSGNTQVHNEAPSRPARRALIGGWLGFEFRRTGS